MRKIIDFLSKKQVLPLIAGLASGLYPWAFYYTNNFDFVNSWDHFYFFLIVFILLPTLSYYLIYILMRKKYPVLYEKVVLPFVSTFVFFYFSMIALYAYVGYKKIALAIMLSILVTVACAYFKNLFSKILAVQFLLVLTTAYTLAYIAKEYVFYSDQWLEQPAAISNVKFSKTPNIYVIQPDGYVNFSELKQGHYNFDNSEFEHWLENLGFDLYEDFRSNYPSTLSSNSSMFAMKHHFYDQLDERKTIMDLNPVVKIFKENGYKTHFLSEIPYLITNRPKISFDYMNFSFNDIPYLSKGLDTRRDILEDFPSIIKTQTGPSFYFFEKILPGHITTYKDRAKSIPEERDRYIKNLEHANQWLKNLISQINIHDPEALIIIVADHGGFVGMEYTLQSKIKTQDRDLLFSVFSAALAIKWPKDLKPEKELRFKSAVNLFINLFAHLSENDELIKYLQDDASYLNIDDGAPRGIYKVIDENGNILFEKHN